MNRHQVKVSSGFLALTAAALFCCCGGASAFNYDEHRFLGDHAFSDFMADLRKSGQFPDMESECDYLGQKLSLVCDNSKPAPYFSALSNPPNYISYGVLNGLSGDQEDNALRLHEGLVHRYSAMNQIVAFKDKKDSQFTDRAKYAEIAALNPDFVYLAISNFAHFYNYGSSLDEHIAKVDKEDLRLLESPSTAETVFTNLERSNALAAYITVHAAAISLAEKAGSLARTAPEASRKYLSYAFLYEAFCAHFLEDSFASGHIVVRRSALGGIINNKSLHDFYNTLGLNVMNLNGDIWKTYGDNTLLTIPDQWEHAASYADVAVSTDTPHAAMARLAVSVSLGEVWAAYRGTENGEPYTGIVERFPGNDSEKEKFALDNFRALHYVPVPFGSDLSRYPLPEAKRAELEEVNAPPQSRNFIRSRVANTITALLGAYQEGSQQVKDLFGLRLNVMSYANYHDLPNKSGSVDNWSGYTFSYFMATSGKLVPDVTRLALGKSYFWDIWVSRKHYFSVYSTLETGLMREDDVNRIVFSPSIGIQPGPLLGLDNYTLPRWIWTPMQFILPLKFSVGANYVPHRAPGYTVMGEIDLLF